jgi:uncharacterized phage protein gp47/JayE
MAFGVTSTGFNKPTEADIEAELVEDFKAEFGDDVTLTPQTFLGQQLAIKKKREMQVWDAAESVYYSFFGTTATGVNLDRALFPFDREEAKKAGTILEFTGDAGETVPAGSQASTSDGVLFETLSAAEIESGGTVSVAAAAVEAGSAGNRATGTITNLPVTIPGVDSVTNTTPATGGTDSETDADFLARVQEEAQNSRGSSVPAIKEALLDLDGINSCNVEENATDATVGIMPPNSVRVIVRGSATDQQIAEAIFNVVAGGIGTVGSEEVTILDGADEYIIRFDRVVAVNVYAEYVLSVNSDWSSDFVDTIKARFLSYVGGVDPGGNNFEGIIAGVDVLNWKAIASQGVTDDLGIVEMVVYLSRNEDPSAGDGDANVEIGSDEEAVTDYDFINVVANPV